METKRILNYRVTLAVFAVSTLVFAILDTLYFKLINSDGLVLLSIILGAMTTINPKKSKEVRYSKKTAKVLITLLIFIIVAGMGTFFLVV